MAWVEQHGNRFHVAIRIGERRFKKTLRTSDRRAADAVAQRIDQRLRLIESGEVVLPDGADLVTYLFSDGRVERPVVLEETLGRPLAATIDEYLESVSTGTIESNTLLTLKIHLKHLVDVLGGKFILDRLSFADLQRYVDARAREKGRRGKPLSPATIRKELVSFGAVWSWAARMGYVKQAFPKQGLRFPKVDEKPAFQTFAEIQARIARGGMSDEEQADLWDCLYFTTGELDAVLQHVQEHALHSFIYPMVLMAAHTGARRSELMRMEVADVDLESGVVRIRERKRSKGKRTTRSVPLSPRLREVLTDWLPQTQGRWVFSQGGEPLTVDEALHHLKWTLADSDWRHVRGWHVFRHSFISNCASQAVDQRMIDDWTGHQTDEMRKRYRHLLPSAQRTAIEAVFGR